MPDLVPIQINGVSLSVPEGTAVAAALALAGHSRFRSSVTGEPRGPLCGMGICMECRVTINGLSNCRSCQTLCSHGMRITTDV
jgi:hypothetical protein